MLLKVLGDPHDGASEPRGKTPLAFAVQAKEDEIVKLLREGAENRKQARACIGSTSCAEEFASAQVPTHAATKLMSHPRIAEMRERILSRQANQQAASQRDAVLTD